MEAFEIVLTPRTAFTRRIGSLLALFMIEVALLKDGRGLCVMDRWSRREKQSVISRCTPRICVD